MSELEVSYTAAEAYQRSSETLKDEHASALLEQIVDRIRKASAVGERSIEMNRYPDTLPTPVVQALRKAGYIVDYLWRDSSRTLISWRAPDALG